MAIGSSKADSNKYAILIFKNQDANVMAKTKVVNIF
jgi:hypothetical protein